MPYAPTFTFRTHGGVCAGEQWIWADDEPIACLRHDAVGQPEQNLRYFNKVLNPIELRNLRLAPGGRPLFAGVQLYWKMGPVITTELVGLEVRGNATRALVLTVVSRDPGGVATSTRQVRITYNSALRSFVFAVEARLRIHSPEVFDTPDDRARQAVIGFEYCDPWYCDIPAPSTVFPGCWPKRYSCLLGEKADGSVWRLPLNHMATGIPAPQAFADGGLLVLAADPGANPAIEFTGATAARTSVAICNWGYDVHMVARYPWHELYRPLVERFRLRLCPDATVRALLERAAPVPDIRYGERTELPLYERRTSFAHGLELSRPAPGQTDPWPWLPAGPGAAWCRDFGRSDTCSLRISKDAAGPTEWTMNREGDGAWTQRWHAGTGFRLTGFVRTDGAGGRGACLALRWAVYNAPERFPLVCSRRLVGTHGWTRLQVQLAGPPPPDVSGVCLVYRQDGPGTSWLDDLELELL